LNIDSRNGSRISPRQPRARHGRGAELVTIKHSAGTSFTLDPEQRANESSRFYLPAAPSTAKLLPQLRQVCGRCTQVSRADVSGAGSSVPGLSGISANCRIGQFIREEGPPGAQEEGGGRQPMGGVLIVLFHGSAGSSFGGFWLNSVYPALALRAFFSVSLSLGSSMITRKSQSSANSRSHCKEEDFIFRFSSAWLLVSCYLSWPTLQRLLDAVCLLSVLEAIPFPNLVDSPVARQIPFFRAPSGRFAFRAFSSCHGRSVHCPVPPTAVNLTDGLDGWRSAARSSPAGALTVLNLREQQLPLGHLSRDSVHSAAFGELTVFLRARWWGALAGISLVQTRIPRKFSWATLARLSLGGTLGHHCRYH